MPEPSDRPDSSSPPPATPAEIAAAGPFPAVDGVLDRALALVQYLREHCPWDRKQTSRSLVPHLLEEVHETVEAIDSGKAEVLRGELGDLLLNLAFQIVIAEEGDRFDRDGVVRELEEKMIRRHPHLFGLGEKEDWEAVKARERESGRSRDRAPAGALDDTPRALDPLLRAYRMQEKAAGVGFDWDDVSGAMAKVHEELAELQSVLDAGEPEEVEEEIGDLLFAVVNVARLARAHPRPALEAANRKFRRRFEALEELARERGVLVPGASLAELDRLWDEVKERE